jgi:hypothetical protein
MCNGTVFLFVASIRGNPRNQVPFISLHWQAMSFLHLFTAIIKVLNYSSQTPGKLLSSQYVTIKLLMFDYFPLVKPWIVSMNFRFGYCLLFIFESPNLTAQSLCQISTHVLTSSAEDMPNTRNPSSSNIHVIIKHYYHKNSVFSVP